jgi:hypothetical protein
LASDVILAGVTLWPGLFLTPRATSTSVSVEVVPTQGAPVVQRYNFGTGNLMELGCSLSGNKAIGGYHLYGSLFFLQQALNNGLPVPLLYHDDPERSVLIISVPENPIKQVSQPELAPEWSAASWYTGTIKLMQV